MLKLTQKRSRKMFTTHIRLTLGAQGHWASTLAPDRFRVLMAPHRALGRCALALAEHPITQPKHHTSRSTCRSVTMFRIEGRSAPFFISFATSSLDGRTLKVVLFAFMNSNPTNIIPLRVNHRAF